MYLNLKSHLFAHRDPSPQSPTPQEIDSFEEVSFSECPEKALKNHPLYHGVNPRPIHLHLAPFLWEFSCVIVMIGNGKYIQYILTWTQEQNLVIFSSQSTRSIYP